MKLDNCNPAREEREERKGKIKKFEFPETRIRQSETNWVLLPHSCARTIRESQRKERENKKMAERQNQKL